MAAWIRAIARMMMPSWAELGFSARSIQNTLKETYGEAYRWTTLLDDYRGFVDAFKTAKVWAKVPDDKEVPLGDYTWLRWDRPIDFYLQGQAVVENVHTGEQYEKWISMYTNEHVTKDEYAAMYAEDQEDNPSDPEWRVVSVRFEKFYRHRGPKASAHW